MDMPGIELKDVLAIEGGEGSEEEQAVAMQKAINDGIGWKLQGSFGRAMMAAIENGSVMLGHEARRDYWGNLIPSRHDVKPGTKGSLAFVAARKGDDWANALAVIP